jgi:hypothetical protein
MYIHGGLPAASLLFLIIKTQEISHSTLREDKALYGPFPR